MATDRRPDKARLARKVRDLRVARHWTQAELAAQLGLSQNRLSEIERGGGSFTAEQFLTILRLFNVTTDHFVNAKVDPEQSLQNALARLGAAHLRESDDVLPSERLREVDAVLREVLVAPESPRLLTALAPVLIQNIDQVQLNKLALTLADIALEQRLGWLLENTLAAIAEDAPQAKKSRLRLYRRAEVVLRSFLARTGASWAERVIVRGPDVFDASIRSGKTLEEVIAKASSISRRWHIASDLQVSDFVEALRGARAAD